MARSNSPVVKGWVTVSKKAWLARPMAWKAGSEREGRFTPLPPGFFVAADSGAAWVRLISLGWAGWSSWISPRSTGIGRAVMCRTGKVSRRDMTSWRWLSGQTTERENSLVTWSVLQGLLLATLCQACKPMSIGVAHTNARVAMMAMTAATTM